VNLDGKHAQELDRYLRNVQQFRSNIWLRQDNFFGEAEVSVNRASNRSSAHVHVTVRRFPQSEQATHVADYHCCPGTCLADLATAFERMKKLLGRCEPLFDSLFIESADPADPADPADSAVPRDTVYHLARSAWLEMFEMELQPIIEALDPVIFRKQELERVSPLPLLLKIRQGHAAGCDRCYWTPIGGDGDTDGGDDTGSGDGGDTDGGDHGNTDADGDTDGGDDDGVESTGKLPLINWDDLFGQRRFWYWYYKDMELGGELELAAEMARTGQLAVTREIGQLVARKLTLFQNQWRKKIAGQTAVIQLPDRYVLKFEFDKASAYANLFSTDETNCLTMDLVTEGRDGAYVEWFEDEENGWTARGEVSLRDVDNNEELLGRNYRPFDFAAFKRFMHVIESTT